MAASATISQSIPTPPRSGSFQLSGVCGAGGTTAARAAALTWLASSLVPPVRVFRVLEIPERPPALHHRQGGEVVGGRRRADRPFQGPRGPRVVARVLSPAKRTAER